METTRICQKTHSSANIFTTAGSPEVHEDALDSLRQGLSNDVSHDVARAARHGDGRVPAWNPSRPVAPTLEAYDSSPARETVSHSRMRPDSSYSSYSPRVVSASVRAATRDDGALSRVNNESSLAR